LPYRQKGIKNSLFPAKIRDVRIIENPERKMAIIEIEPKDKAKAIGKNGKTIG
jgi:transcription antitermination factor NusA-like protein